MLTDDVRIVKLLLMLLNSKSIVMVFNLVKKDSTTEILWQITLLSKVLENSLTKSLCWNPDVEKS